MFNLQDYVRLRNGLLIISLLAWVLLWAGRDQVSLCSAPGGGSGWDLLQGTAVGDIAKGWVVMLVAMMAPTLAAPLYFVYRSSFSRLRIRLMGLCLVGYAAVWLAAGAFLTVVELAIKARYPGSWWPALVAGGAALVWQASPWKKACLNRCHTHRPIGAFGLAAHRGAFRLGLEQGVWCGGSCWLNMLGAMLLPGGHLWGMMAVAVLMFCERLDPGAAPTWRLRGFRTAAWCLTCLWRRARKRLLPETQPQAA